ncbi:hypothetical protein KM043_004792 [Ampulex compressa]|nr:hypothetical protein KM043_004792 [Ampulex compressa]
MYSDNGTTFTGAARQLKEFYEFIGKDQVQTDIKEFLRRSEISWSFIPPSASYFGGLWEAAVKSAKLHMHRIIGEAHLTFEEMLTILCEIEAILNSRPLTPLTEDPNDLMCRTPGHFLVGDALNSFPCPDLTDTNVNRLVRWQRVEQIRQHFWKRWSMETHLQTRHKWKRPKGDQLRVGQAVLIKQHGLAPLQWISGRVREVHPGSDSVIRSATMKTVKGLITRPLSKLAILPI